MRIGPAWRTSEELEWCHSIARAVVTEVPEVVAPLASGTRATIVRVEGRPLSVWPFVEGCWPNVNDEGMRRQAASLLARLHTALAAVDVGPRPAGGERPGSDAATTEQISQYLELHGYSADVDLVDAGGDVIGDFVDLITEWDNPQYPFLVLKDKDDSLRFAFEGSIKDEGMRPILDILVRDLLAD